MKWHSLRFPLLAIALPGLFLVVAAQQQQAPPPSPAQAPATSGTEPASVVPAPVDPKTYKVGAEDVLMVRVWREPELSGPQVVRPDGKFSLPLIGEVEAAGLTPVEISAAIIKTLEKFIQRPEVLVSVQQVNSKRFYISGEVNRPGVFPLVVPTTIMQALTMAGGFRDFANTKKIVIMRGTERIPFNYKDVIKGKKLEQNILLESGDHIIVP